MYIVPKETLHAQTVKLTLNHRDKIPKSAICKRPFHRSDGTKPPTYLFSVPSMSNNNTQRDKNPRQRHKITAARPASITLNVTNTTQINPFRTSANQPSVPPVHLSAPGEALSREYHKHPQANSDRKSKKTGKQLIQSGFFDHFSDTTTDTPVAADTPNRNRPGPTVALTQNIGGKAADTTNALSKPTRIRH